jgi:hypothetical protein
MPAHIPPEVRPTFYALKVIEPLVLRLILREPYAEWRCLLVRAGAEHEPRVAAFLEGCESRMRELGRH